MIDQACIIADAAMAGEERTGTGHRGSEPASDPEAWFPRWIGPLAIALASVLLTAWSWEKWADVHIDFGNELYVAWRLVEGDALYADIAQRNGPFSHYLNAVWFELFGVSIRTLVFCNLAVLAAICAMSWRIFRRACGRFTATATTLVLLGVFAFSQYVGIGNYNYVTPYHHSQTHGLALSLAMLLAFGEALRRAPVRWCAVAGAALGCVFLTKAELFVPAAAAAALGLALVMFTSRERALPAAGVFAAMAVLPIAAFFLYLGARMPAGLAWQGVLGNWMHLGSEALDDPFYAGVAGFDDVRGNLLAMLGAFAGIAVFGVLSLGADRLLPRGRAALPASAAAGAALFALLVAWPGLVPWPELARALPLTAGLACAGLLAVCARRRGNREVLARWGPLALYALLALALLAKL
ncbi:MAG: glycosyltransferase family 39 protein, partial [Deltaproteobacteria bacterium]|nr:glycosyltransferase family 39 protein [Deltaproteobacteria bacterium]